MRKARANAVKVFMDATVMEAPLKLELQRLEQQAVATKQKYARQIEMIRGWSLPPPPPPPT